MGRLLIFFVTRRKGLIVLSILLILAGLAWGAVGTHQVTYAPSDDQSKYEIAKGDTSGNIYINPKDSDTYYVAFPSEFVVAQSDIDNSASISFIARTDTSSLDPVLNAPDGSTINDAHEIEKLVFYDDNNTVLHTYTSAEYVAHPNGFNDNEWTSAIWLIIIGGIILVLALFVRRSRNQPAGANMNFAGGMNNPQMQQSYGVPPTQYPPYGAPAGQQTPYPQPNPYPQQQQQAPYPPQNPYPQQDPYGQGQPYQGVNQYPQNVPPQYGQDNPYQQPPQH